MPPYFLFLFLSISRDVSAVDCTSPSFSTNYRNASPQPEVEGQSHQPDLPSLSPVLLTWLNNRTCSWLSSEAGNEDQNEHVLIYAKSVVSKYCQYNADCQLCCSTGTLQQRCCHQIISNGVFLLTHKAGGNLKEQQAGLPPLLPLPRLT